MKRPLSLASLLCMLSYFAYANNSDLEQCRSLNEDSYSACERLAKQGNADGQFGLGMLLLEGRGIPRNHNASFKLMYKAAMQGHSPAQLQVAQAYVNGEGVEIDYEEAYAWFLISNENGNPLAQKGIDYMDESGVIPLNRMNEITQRANDLYAKTKNKKGFKFMHKEKKISVSNLKEYCDMVMPTVDGIITLRKYDKPRSLAQQLMVGMTDPKAINMMNGVIDWVWSTNVPPAKMSVYFKNQCLSQSSEISFIFQSP